MSRWVCVSVGTLSLLWVGMGLAQTISKVAGTGERGFAGDGGPAGEAHPFGPNSVFVDGDGNLYIADTANDRIRRVDPEGVITTVVSVADVTGHAMLAAVPVLMFSGILDNQMESPKPLAELFASLNRSLYRSLDQRTFICFSMVEIDTNDRSMRFADCGCLYPLHYHAATDEVTELRVEATNPEEEMFTLERMEQTVLRGCREGLGAERMLDYLLNEVRSFAGDAPQADDQTIVVLVVESDPT